MKALLFWMPRLLAILIATFFMMFSFDVFDIPAPFWKKIVGFLIHSIPTFLIIFILILSWKKPIWGTYLFTLFFIIATLYFRTYMRVMSFTLLSIPLLVVALLFTIEYFYDKKKVELELEDE